MHAAPRLSAKVKWHCSGRGIVASANTRVADLKADLSSYLVSWSDELRARANRVRQLIGGQHWLSDGHHKEAMIRSFLARYLPQNYIIARGFVRPPSPSVLASSEVDILVSDPALHPPLYWEGDLQIVAPSSVLAHIEVKTKLNRTELRKSLKSVRRVQESLAGYADPSKVWRGVLFAEEQPSLTAEKLSAMLRELILELATTSSGCESQLAVYDYLPVSIATFSKFAVFLTGKNNGNKVQIKVIETNRLSAACFFADMFSAIQESASGKAAIEIDELIEGLELPPPLLCDVKVRAK